MPGYDVRFHPDFSRDLRRLSRREAVAVDSRLVEIQEEPERFKRLHGYLRCFTARVGGFRIIYYLEGRTVWVLMVGRRGQVYREFVKRLYGLRGMLR